MNRGENFWEHGKNQFEDYTQTDFSISEIFFEGFPNHWREADLSDFLNSRNLGKIEALRVITRPDRSKFAFVRFGGNVNQILLKLNHNPVYFDGRKLIASKSRSKKHRPAERVVKQVRIQNDVIELSPNRQELINISRPIFHSSVTFTSNLERDFEDLDRVTRDCSEVLKTSLSLNRLPTKDEIFIAEIDKKPSRCIVTQYLSENSVKALAIDYEKTATLFINRIYQSQDVCQTPSLMTKMRIQYSEPSFNANIGINEIQSIVAKYESFRIDPIGFDSKNELYCHLFGLQGSQWRNIGAELEKNCLVSKLTKHPVLTTEGLSALKMSVEISSSQQISDLNHSNISEGEFLSVQITHLSEKYLRNGELLIHCRNTEMNEEFESVQARMRFFYETEKERIRSDALTDFTDIDYVMFVVKGPLCLRGKVLDFEEGENLHVKAIDFGFEMKVKKKNCFKLEEEFGSIPAMAILVQAMGLELCKDNKEVIKEEINALKKAATELRCQILTAQDPFKVHIPALNDCLIRRGINSSFLS